LHRETAGCRILQISKEMDIPEDKIGPQLMGMAAHLMPSQLSTMPCLLQTNRLQILERQATLNHGFHPKPWIPSNPKYRIAQMDVTSNDICIGMYR